MFEGTRKQKFMASREAKVQRVTPDFRGVPVFKIFKNFKRSFLGSKTPEKSSKGTQKSSVFLKQQRNFEGRQGGSKSKGEGRRRNQRSSRRHNFTKEKRLQEDVRSKRTASQEELQRAREAMLLDGSGEAIHDSQIT
ncbi:hypothetical protein NPIL_410231 [Nephila pilipes]|uniref:Uncharacterized protein n=1 Tax=Nephila pilipes TaxID=299642 RepID=A0A8X6NBP7_NEPPI|nr:hypothetical protein NPIL_410231 [Nephila pilipes]